MSQSSSGGGVIQSDFATITMLGVPGPTVEEDVEQTSQV